MEKYRSLRRAGGEDAHADEIEYNFGRAFHHIGAQSSNMSIVSRLITASRFTHIRSEALRGSTTYSREKEANAGGCKSLTPGFLYV